MISKIGRGFTLVELMLSVVILGFGLCIVLQSYLSSLHGLDASQNYLEAVRFAKEKLDGLTIAAYENSGLLPEVKTGKAILGLREFNWESEVSEIHDPAYLSEDLVTASVNLDWRERNIAKNTVLATYLPKKKEEKKKE